MRSILLAIIAHDSFRVDLENLPPSRQQMERFSRFQGDICRTDLGLALLYFLSRILSVFSMDEVIEVMMFRK